MNKHFRITLIVTFFLVQIWSTLVLAHCEIPCGIYNDKLRINLLNEHITTIEKSMTQIMEYSKDGNKNYNQLIRWVNNKEEHANQFQDIITQYFMTQRLKVPADLTGKEAYLDKLTLLHEMLIIAMKTKQTTDIEHCKKLKLIVDKFSAAYFDREDQEHLQKHQ